MHLADGPHQFVRGGVFEQVPTGPGLDRGKHLVVGRKAGQHEDATFGRAAGDLACRLDPVHTGHQQVHQDDVRAALLGAQYGFLPVARFAHDLEAAGFGEQRADSLAHDGMVVDYQDTNA